jgi:hypothetical protein
MSLGIGISVNSEWVVLTGEDQFGDEAKRILEGDTSRPRAPIKPQPPIDWGNLSKFSMPVIKQLAPDTVLKDLVSVQPMDLPLDPAFKFTFVTTEESARRKKESRDKMSEELQEGEILKQYMYGGCLSERGGWFVVHKDTPYLVRRYRPTWMS